MTASHPEPMVDVALRYASAGLSVFPAYTIDEGACSCHSVSCKSPGKHPIASLVPHGVLEATTDEMTVRQWWLLFPDANIGIATGDPSAIVVVDVDAGGEDTLGHLEERHGELGATWLVNTGSGGMHLYYRMPSADVRNSAGAIGPGVDVRGNGGYVIAPPSLHVSGGHYRWDDNWHPRKVRMADLPEWLLNRMVPQGSRRAAAPLPQVLKEGVRNSWLTSAAGTMRRRGFGQTAITAALKAENRERCKPPLDDREVERIAYSIMRYGTEEATSVSA